MNEIKKAKNLSARLKIAGKDNYKMERSFDVMDKAAENESGAGAAFINAGLGFGATMNIGKQMADQLSPEQNNTPPPIPVNIDYYLAINGKQAGPYSASQIQQAINQDSSVLKILAWKKGMTSWANLETFPEFNHPQNDSSVPPPIPNKL